ncbi:hypothetical protein KW850_27065 [Bacillus sp. sid0103]|uniref:hypothetical protein n=1 Tax=Bacillus sp. sid0103 TaxID=2856337 RepID=UPI001C48BF2F|nr:hypothetical protein [Bacillus sp. sid0103]MBV7508867.1 hypothetical protein [Bacillus sp. sid0103]
MVLGNIEIKVGDKVQPASKVAAIVYYNSNRAERTEVFEKWKDEWKRESNL